MKKIITISLSVVFLAACSTSNNVVSNKLFQKRKYQKGWHVNSTKKIDKSTSVDTEEVAYETVPEEKIDKTVINSVIDNNTTPRISNSIQIENEVYEETSIENEIFFSNTNSSKVMVETIVNENLVELTEESRVLDVISEETNSSSSNSDSEVGTIGIILLCVFLPVVAVGFATGGDLTTMLINVLWSLLCGIPGIIHAFIIVQREGLL